MPSKSTQIQELAKPADKKSDSFQRDDGGGISFVPGHLEFVDDTMGLPKKTAVDLEIASINAAGGHKEIDYGKISETLDEKQVRVGLKKYAVRLERCYQMIDALEQVGKNEPFDRLLDIGCGNAIQRVSSRD